MIGGLILNKVGGQAHLTWLTEAMEAAGVKAPVLGGLPKVCQAAMARHMTDKVWAGKKTA